MPNYLEIHAQMYKLWLGQIGTDRRMHARTAIHRIEVVITMFRSIQTGSTKMAV